MGSLVEGSERRLRDEVQTGFDGLAQRLDKLEGEYHMLVAGLKRVDERLDAASFIRVGYLRSKTRSARVA